MSPVIPSGDGGLSGTLTRRTLAGLTLRADRLAFQQVAGANVKDGAQGVGKTHVEPVDATLGRDEAKGRAPRNVVALDLRGELVGVLRRLLPLHQFGDSDAHLQHVTDTNAFVTNVKRDTDAATGIDDTIDTSEQTPHIGGVPTELESVMLALQ